jgi:SAM-dependent methyltransferase
MSDKSSGTGEFLFVKHIERGQIDYYRARAGEYDEWFLRQGRYDRGPELNARWHSELATVARALDEFRPAGRVLELACGTGLWTERLLPHASEIIAVDAAPETIALNRARVGSSRVQYVNADLFSWEPSGADFDVVFFSFWLSHVPPRRFEAFWRLIGSSLRSGGRFFLIDSLRDPTSTATDHSLPARDSAIVTRKLNDGREFEIYKIFYEPSTLTERVAALGFALEAHATPTYFLYASGAPDPIPPR